MYIYIYMCVSLFTDTAGDIVEYDPRLNDIAVIDRKKNFIKLAQSLFVAPEHIENVLTTCALVSSIWVYAKSIEDCVLAVVHPNRELLTNHAISQGLSFSSFEDLCAQPEAAALVQRELVVEAKKRLQPHEIPRAVLLESTAWSPTTGELTVSLKLARIALTLKYGARLALLYDRLAGRVPAPNAGHDQGDAPHPPQNPALPNGSSPAAPAPANDAPTAMDITLSSSPAAARLAGKRAQFTEILSSVLSTPKDQIHWDSTLAEGGLDSTAVVLLISLLKANHINLPWDRLYRTPLRTIAEAIELGQAESARAAAIDWAAECTLPPNVHSLCASYFARRCPKESQMNTFLTGATGFLGSSILRELLMMGVRVTCLVRAESAVAGLRRILEAASFYGMRSDVDRFLPNLIIVTGDMAKPNLGLHDTAWAELMASGLHAVIHNGARVNGVLPYAILRDDNVLSTVTCISLAARVGAKLIFVSSLSSLATFEPGEEKSSPLPTGPLSLMSGYGASKRVSEILIHQAFQAGFKACCIVRPGTIGPCLRTGCLSPGDTLTRLLQAVVQLSIAPRHMERFSVCSVTEIAQLCARLAVRRSSLTTDVSPPECLPAINMFGPSEISLQDLIAAALAAGRRVQSVPMFEFLDRMRSSQDEAECALKPIQSYFEHSDFPLGIEAFSATAAHRHCAQLDVTRTALTKRDFENAIKWLESRKLLPPLSVVTEHAGRRVRESWA
jgi:thioester reductase-like protein